MMSESKEKSFGEKLMKRLSIREKANGVPLVKRKPNKPLTEKKRRDKINKCLVQLKNIILRAKGKEEKKFARLEKADILEMTLSHLMEIHGQTDRHKDRRTEDLRTCTPAYDSVMENIRCLNGLQNNNWSRYPTPHGSVYPLTPRYQLGNGQKVITDVNFEHEDMIDDDVMCGSASRVFVMGENSCGSFSADLQDGWKQKIQDKSVNMETSRDDQSYRDNQGNHVYGSSYVQEDLIYSKKNLSPVGCLPCATSTPKAISYGLDTQNSEEISMVKGQTYALKSNSSLRNWSHMPHERLVGHTSDLNTPELAVLREMHGDRNKGQGHVDVSFDPRARLFSYSLSSSDDSCSARVRIQSKSPDTSTGPSSSDSSYQKPWRPW